MVRIPYTHHNDGVVINLLDKSPNSNFPTAQMFLILQIPRNCGASKCQTCTPEGQESERCRE